MKVPKGQKVPKESPKPSHDLQTRLGTAIKVERQRLGVTQEELAWRADMHRTYLADIERGARNITLRSIANLARALEMSVAGLLLGPESSRSPSHSSPGPGEILLVEDENTDAELARRAFRRARVANPIKVVRDGRQALDYLYCRGRFAKRRPVNPELLLLDLHLPGMSGVDVLREIKGQPRTKGIPVVVLTVSRDDRTILECARLGASQYILKPVEFAGISKVTPRLNLHWTLARRPGGRDPSEK